MSERSAHWRHFWRILRAMSAIGAALAVAVLVYLRWSGAPMPWQGRLAVGLGVLLTLMLAGALMGLVFLSSRSGHDARTDHDPEHD